MRLTNHQKEKRFNRQLSATDFFEFGKLFFLVSTIAILVTACEEKMLHSCNLPKVSSEKIERTETANLSIFIDGTPSMVGYVSNNIDSRYKKILDSIDQISTTTWSKPKYFRFGQKKQLIDRDTYRSAKLPSFYQGGANFSVSQIDKLLLDPPGKDRVTIIVSDLYQKNADLGRVQQVLTQNYLKQGYSIGTLGVKSEFNGTIFDVGLTNQQFGYSTLGLNSEKYHPFYVLILGTYGNVYHFYEQMQQYGLKSVQHEFIIFSPQLVSQVSSLDPKAVKKEDGRGLTRPQTLKDNYLLLRKNGKESVQFLLMDRHSTSKSLTEELTYFPLSKVLQPSRSEVQREDRQYSPKRKSFESIGSLSGIQIENGNIERNSFKFNLDLKPDQFDKGIYTLTAKVFPETLQQPDWWQSWSSDENGLDGSKTNNLFRFMNGLSGNTLDSIREGNHAIAQLCYAIQKK
ncbi:MAG TPA: hypothetical protein V6D19_19115 [Stenomitos sp.]